ncbi:MAG: FecR domain-containing protein, partial [Planctomycetes bacterium]|nr:FecR domain-containing protein [Planctomycetota bacterium]
VLEFKDLGYVTLSKLSADKVDKKVSVKLSLGKVRCKVNKLKAKSSFVIKSPVSVAGVRGTDFGVSVGSDGTTDIDVEEGEVEVGSVDEGSFEPVSVGAGETTTVRPTTTTSPNVGDGVSDQGSDNGQSDDEQDYGDSDEDEGDELLIPPTPDEIIEDITPGDEGGSLDGIPLDEIPEIKIDFDTNI